MKSTYSIPLFSHLLAISVITSPAIHAEATVAASWDYQTLDNNFDQGAVNSPVFSGNFSQLIGSFEKTTADASIAVSASEGRVRLLNRFSTRDGTIGRFGISQLVNVRVRGGFADRLTIVDARRTGQPGFYTGSIRVDLDYMGVAETGSRNVFGVGVGDSLSSASAASENIFYNNGGRSTYAYLGFTASDPQSYSNHVVTFTVPIVFGEEFGMAVWMQSLVGTEGRTNFGTTKSHDASNTVTWAGTALVQDATGATVPAGSYDLISTSSRNYLTANTGTATFSEWATGHELTGDDATPSADPNHNGLSNVLEYAFGLDSESNGALTLPEAGFTTVQGQRYLTLTYSRPAGVEARTDLIYAPQRATTLQPANWTEGSANVTYSITPELNNRETVTVRSMHPLATAGDIEFLRLKLILQEP